MPKKATTPRRTTIHLNKETVDEMLAAHALGIWSALCDAMRDLEQANEDDPTYRELVKEGIEKALAFADAYRARFPDEVVAPPSQRRRT